MKSINSYNINIYIYILIITNGQASLGRFNEPMKLPRSHTKLHIKRRSRISCSSISSLRASQSLACRERHQWCAEAKWWGPCVSNQSDFGITRIHLNTTDHWDKGYKWDAWKYLWYNNNFGMTIALGSDIQTYHQVQGHTMSKCHESTDRLTNTEQQNQQVRSNTCVPDHPFRRPGRTGQVI